MPGNGRFLALCLSFTLSLSAVSSWETADHPQDCELLLTQVVFRHGDRNPIQPYPTDPYKNESNWPEGYGQLTKIGKKQQFELGKFLRGRYDGFLGSVYSPYEIYVQSSSVDRAIMSAEANLAALYPPNDNQSLWNPQIPWQPIPVHNMPENMDNVIALRESCPRYDQIYQDFEKSDLMQKLYKDNHELFQIIANHTGKNVTTIKDLDYTLDTLYVEKLYNKTWPDWATEVFAKYGDRLRELVSFSFKVTTYTMEMKKLRGGPLLKEITEHMKAKTNHSMDERRKFFVYSGHDVTVATLLNTLGVFNDMAPPYCSLVMIELHRNMTSNSYFVEILFRNSTTSSDTYKLQLPGCDFSCDLSKFLDLTSSFIPEDWNKECEATPPTGYDAVGLIVTAMLLFIVFGLCVAIGLILKAYLRNKRVGEPQPPKYPYLHLQMEDGDEEPA